MALRSVKHAEPHLPYLANHKRFPTRVLHLNGPTKLRELKQRYSPQASAPSSRRSQPDWTSLLLSTAPVQLSRSMLSESLPQSPSPKKGSPLLARRHFRPHFSRLV